MELYLHTTAYNAQDQAIQITVHAQVLVQDYCIGYCPRQHKSDSVKEISAEIISIYNEVGEEITLSSFQEEQLLDELLTLYSQAETLEAERLECIKEDRIRAP